MTRVLVMLVLASFGSACLFSENAANRKTLQKLQAYEFHYRSPDCRVRLPQHSNETLYKQISEGLKSRGWKLFPLEENKFLFPKELYFTMEQKKSTENNSLYKNCTVNITLKKAKANQPSPQDTTLYTGRGSRNHPRITLEGRERCQRAATEALLHIPYCLKPKEWIELQKKFNP